LVKNLINQNRDFRSFDYNKFQEFFQQVIERHTAISKAALSKVLEPQHFIAVRDRLGGPASSALTSSLRDRKGKRACGIKDKGNDRGTKTARRDQETFAKGVLISG